MELKVYGNIIKAERKVKNLSQIELANELKMNQSTISRAEKGEINNPKIYETIFHNFDLELTDESKNVFTYIEAIYEQMEFNNMNKEEEIFLELMKITSLGYREHYLKKIAECLHYLYHKNFEQLKITLEYVSHFDFLFDEDIMRYLYLVRGYYYHIKKEYQQADSEFKKILPILFKHKKTDHVFSYIYAWNHIILGNYSIAQIVLENSKTLSKEKNNIVRVYHINRLLAYVHFLQENYKETIELSKEFFMMKNNVLTNKQINLQVEFIMASSFILLKKYDEAIKYLRIIVEENKADWNYEIYYAYLLYCLKVSNHQNYHQKYKQFKQDTVFENKNKRNLVESFLSDESDPGLFLYKFDYVIDKFENSDLNNKLQLKLLYTVFQNGIWKRRKYSLYKKLNELVIRNNIGVLNYDL